VLGAAGAAIFLQVRTPSYRSETVILYSEGVRLSQDEDLPANARSVTVRLKEILLSRATLDSVVREFDLYPETRQKQGAVDAVEELRKHVEFRAPGGDTFSIAFTGSSPTQAQAVTARLAALVIEQDSDLRKKQATLTRDFLKKEKVATEARLKYAETKLASFLVENPRFALDLTPLQTGAAIRANMGSQPSAPRAAAGPPIARGPLVVPPPASSGTSPSPPMPRPDAAEARESLQRANAAFAAARANLADLSERFTPAHPDVRAAQNEVERARTRLALASAQVTPEAPPPVAMPAPRPAQAPPPKWVPRASTGASAPAKAERPPERDVVALETEWVKLTRSVTEARKRQDDVESALFKANTAVASENAGHGVQVTTIDPAYLPQSAVPPGRMLIVALFLAAALLMGVSLAAFKAWADDSVQSARDLGRFGKLLVEVPRASTRRAHVPS
jgi:uncharacterized protein involved in exopolysaccharide biosynthesis